MSRYSAAVLFSVSICLSTASGAGASPPVELLFSDGFESGDVSAWETPIAFRMTDLDLRDPHIFASVAPLGCMDMTDLEQFGIEGVNPHLQNQIQEDEEPDGFLDLSLANVFRPPNPSPGASSPMSLVYPTCSAPFLSTTCTLEAGSPEYPGIANSLGDDAVCLGPIDGTTSAYSPALVSAIAPAGGTCYAAHVGTIVVPLIVPIVLVDSWIGGEWFDSPVSEIRDGILRGFLSQATAEATVIPEGTTGIDSIDGSPLSSLLRGGVSSCSQPSPAQGDKDSYLGNPGWYVYLNFEAVLVPYSQL